MNATKASKTSMSKAQAGVRIGSAKELQAQALKALGRKPTLQTEKDGQRFAILSLQALERLEYSNQKTMRLFDSWSAKAEAPDDSEPGMMMICRAGPQTPVLKDAFDKIYREGTEEARRGFFVVMTDYIGAVVCGAGIPDISHYERIRDELQPWGSANYRNPKAAARAIAKGEDAYRFRPLTKAEKREAAKEKSAKAAAAALAKGRAD